jgi:hypothetical protein
MTLKITEDNEIETDPPKLRVLAATKEIILKSDPSNTQDIEVAFVQDPHTIFTNVPAAKEVKVEKGKQVRLIIRQDLPLKKRGTFKSHHDADFARAIELDFKGLARTEQGDHADFHIEC